jgi:hypothetical protein
MIYGCSQGDGTVVKQWIVGNLDRSKVLDSLDNWTLEKIDEGWAEFNDHTATSRARYLSLIKHECYPGGRGRPTGEVVHQVVCYPDDSTHCWRCEEVIPDKMVVLWKFMNHEQIQYRDRHR